MTPFVFFLIVAGLLAALTGFALWSLRYLLAGVALRRVRIALLAIDVLLGGMLVVGGWRFGFFGVGPGIFVTAFFMAQLFLAVLLTLVALCRGAWRRMLGVPYEAARRRTIRRGIVCPVLAAGAAAYGATEGRTGEVVRRFEVPMAHLPAESAIWLAQLSDIHLGGFFTLADLEGLLMRTAALSPDLLVITGDLFDNDEMNAEAARIVDSHVGDYPLGIAFILGNHEYFHHPARILETLAATRILFLRNESREITDGLYLAGVDYPTQRNVFDVTTASYADAAMADVPAGAATVLLAHHPNFIDEGERLGAGLTLTGHTHGGQFGLFGVPLFPGFRYTRGIVAKEHSIGYVHSGNGSWFPFRIGCPPEIALFHLVPGDA